MREGRELLLFIDFDECIVMTYAKHAEHDSVMCNDGLAHVVRGWVKH